MDDEDEFNLTGLSKYQTEKTEAEKKALHASAQGDPELEAILAETKMVQKDTLLSTQSSVKTLK